MYEPQCINIKACKFIKFNYLQLFIIKYINKVDIIIKPKLLTFNRLRVSSVLLTFSYNIDKII